MKRMYCMLLTLAFFLEAMAQQQLVVKDKAYYLNKSKNQKTAAWILAGLGGAMMVGGAIGFAQNFEVFGPGGETEAAIMIAGAPVALASIPFFISAARNKGRAEVLVGPQLQPLRLYGGNSRLAPGIGVQIRF